MCFDEALDDRKHRHESRRPDKERHCLRIAIIGPYFWPKNYGIDKVMYVHAKYLAARGHDVRVFTSRLRYPRGEAIDLPATEPLDGFTIQRVGVVARSVPFLHYPSNGGLILSGLQRALNSFAPEVVHAHNDGAAAWAYGGARCARRTKSAFFYSPYNHPARLRLGAVRKSMIRAMNHLPLTSASKIYHATSLDMTFFAKEYPYAPRDRFALLLNGVEPPQTGLSRANQQDSPLRVLFVGRVDDVRKGFAYLERTMDTLPEETRKRFLLTVVGLISDASRQRLEAKYGQMVRVMGPVSSIDLERAYADAHIFVMPSLYEGFGMPYIEAMRYGVPVIGTTVGGVPEVVAPDTGLLIPSADVTALSSALTRLVIDSALRLQLGSAGREWSKRFYWDAIISTLEADYDHAVEKSKN